MYNRSSFGIVECTSECRTKSRHGLDCTAFVRTLGDMNRLSADRRASIVAALCEGNGVRATARLTGSNKETVMKVLVEVGEFASAYQDIAHRDLRTARVEADEIWAFVGAKQRRAVRPGDGDIWTFTAVDADTRLMVSWLVGPRSIENA